MCVEHRVDVASVPNCLSFAHNQEAGRYYTQANEYATMRFARFSILVCRQEQALVMLLFDISVFVLIGKRSVARGTVTRRTVARGHLLALQPLRMDHYIPSKVPEEVEIDNEVWYKSEMISHEPDIMKFLVELDNPIFRYKWNSQIWLQQFQQSMNIDSKYQPNTPTDQICQLLRMTVMLNTIGIIRRKTYLIDNKQIKLNTNGKLKTTLYNHQSMLDYNGIKLLTTTPYTKTRITVINNDCIFVYDDCLKIYKKPVVLNMVNAISSGGGYRKGDGTQEANLFRRSDYFRSLDIDLDNIQHEKSERFYCSNDGRLLPLPNSTRLYPIDKYGAIYTSGLTFFRKSENTGYALMEKLLENVYSLAMPAYDDPRSDGNVEMN